MQHKAVYLLFCKFTLHVSGVNHTHHKEIYFYGSVHRWSILIIVQRYATQSSLFIILQVHSTCFGCQPHPSSGVHKTVTTASGTGPIFCAAISLHHDQAVHSTCFECHQHPSPGVNKTFTTISRSGHIFCAATSLREVCTSDNGCGWRTKHVQWTWRIINRLLCVASRWTIINIDQRCTEP